MSLLEIVVNTKYHSHSLNIYSYFRGKLRQSSDKDEVSEQEKTHFTLNPKAKNIPYQTKLSKHILSTIFDFCIYTKFKSKGFKIVL